MILLDDIRSQTLPPSFASRRKLLIVGPPGCGKTVAARALCARAMGIEALCIEHDLAAAAPWDFRHVNCGAEGGVDAIRALAESARQRPLDPAVRCRSYLLDEVHKLTDAAQQALLLPLEQDDRNVWVACTSKGVGPLDPALVSRLSPIVEWGGADVAAVMRSLGRGEAEAAAAAAAARGDLRVALAGGIAVTPEEAALVVAAGGKLRLRFRDARQLHAAALKSPQQLQARVLGELLEKGIPDGEAYRVMCATLCDRNDVAAHQLVAAARKAGLL